MVYVAVVNGADEREADSIEEFAGVLDEAFSAGLDAFPQAREADGTLRPLSCAEMVQLIDLYASRVTVSRGASSEESAAAA